MRMCAISKGIRASTVIRVPRARAGRGHEEGTEHPRVKVNVEVAVLFLREEILSARGKSAWAHEATSRMIPRTASKSLRG